MACRIRRPKRRQQRSDHGENDVTGFDDPEMQDLLGLAARLGRDPLVVQGPGGNISLKRDGVMWVKARRHLDDGGDIAIHFDTGRFRRST